MFEHLKAHKWKALLSSLLILLPMPVGALLWDRLTDGSTNGFKTLTLYITPLLLFTGSLEFQLHEDSLTVKASYYTDLTVPYDRIDSVEYRGSTDFGYRAAGFGTPRLSMGSFQNEEFGLYTLYAYSGAEDCVILHLDSSVIVLADRSPELTRQLYEQLYEVIG